MLHINILKAFTLGCQAASYIILYMCVCVLLFPLMEPSHEANPCPYALLRHMVVTEGDHHTEPLVWGLVDSTHPYITWNDR